MLRRLKNRINSRREARIHNLTSQIESVPPCTPYQYSPLNAAKDEIRILTILPAIFGTDIRILIEKTRLANDFKPQFEALSYAWGSTDKSSHVRVGVSGNVTLSVTQNLAEALQYLRLTDRPRVFWIDAICVNQQDVGERSQQVNRMADIYSIADRVVAWLGPPENQSLLALRTMSHLSSSILVDWWEFRMSPAPKSDPSWADITIRLPYDDEVWAAIRHLANRSWFERLWVCQEIHLARPGAVLMCGTDTILWAEYRNAILCLQKKALSAINIESLEYAYALSKLYCGREDIMHAIQVTKNSKCSDNRDRIYAITSLCAKSYRRLIVPNYANSVQQVYRNLVLKSIFEIHELNLLGTCNLRTAFDGSPTWVPNWSMPNAYTQISNSVVARTYCCGAAYDGRDVLSVTGVFCGTIDTIYDCSDIGLGAFHYLRDFAPKRALTSLYLGGGTTLEAFCRTIWRDRFRDSYSNPDSDLAWPEINEVMAYVAHMLDADTSTFSDIPIPTSLKILKHLVHRSFFTTSNGYLGIAPAGISPGDCVTVIPGLHTPLIVRPIIDGRYQVAGESFVQGLMHHEGILGLLPKSVRPVWTSVEDELGGDRIGFRDSKTGRVFLEDPRAGPLPEGWERKVKDWNGGASDFENITTGTVTGEDPRLTEQALRARGVELVTIDLV